MKRAAMLKGESLLSKKVSLMRECWVPPTPHLFSFLCFFFLPFSQASLLICAQGNKVKSETMDMFPLTNTGVPPHCKTLYLLFNNDLATTIWTFHRLLLADIDMVLGR